MKNRGFKNTFASMRTYPSKLLLFGEHVLLLGSTALAIPTDTYSGKWVELGGQTDELLQQKLLEFAASDQLNRAGAMDANAFQQDLMRGLVFESSIPMGYGLGSSGALCAAVYDRYCRDKSSDLSALKVAFAAMESFFHGASSGIDPLTSYTGQPLIIRHKVEVTVAAMTQWEQTPIVFLVDTGLPRQTGPLVRWFMEKSTKQGFSDALKTDYLPTNEAVIQHWQSANPDEFWFNLNKLSQFQLDYFEPMIPEIVRNLWLEHLQKGEITFKICGAGGGGFLLGFSKTLAPVQALSRTFNLVFPFRSTP
jgi:mevalonate kinase